MNEPSRRFVLLHHDWPFPHHDLLLEGEDACATWRVLADLSASANPVERIADHRKHYLTYEGPVSGGRGHVRRVDEGDYVCVGRDQYCFAGRLLSGIYTLTESVLQREHD